MPNDSNIANETKYATFSAYDVSIYFKNGICNNPLLWQQMQNNFHIN